jgi:hypothetical protein
MTILMAIISTNPRLLRKAIDEGGEVNATINGQTMLDLAIEVNIQEPSFQGNTIITILRNKGAKTSEELEASRSRKRNLPPLSVKGTVRGNIKTTGIAGLPRGGTLRRRRSRSRKNRG